MANPSGTPDTRTDVEDSGNLVLEDAVAINFGPNVDVSDDGDGSVTVSANTSSDTRTDVSDGGTLVVSDVSDINFGSNVIATDDGDGTVTVDAEGAESWTEDPNSPLQFSGQQSGTITLDGTYDQVKLRVNKFENNSGSSQDLEIRVNGDTTTNYNIVNYNGNTATGTDRWLAMDNPSDDESCFGEIILSGRWDHKIAGNFNLGHTEVGSSGSHSVSHDTLTSPLDTITARGQYGNVDVFIEVFGRDV